MFDAIFSILAALTSSTRNKAGITVRSIDYPKSNEEALRRDWDHIQKDWEAVGIDMTNAINKVASDVQTEQHAR